MMRIIDCIIIGYNEVEFNELAHKQKQFMNRSGAYSELKTNSVLLDGKRCTYIELLNSVLAKATGTPWNLNPFEMPNLGVAYLASFLQRRNFSVEFVNFFNFGRSKLADLLLKSPRAVVITTTYYVDDEPIKQIVKFVRQHNSEVKIIVGGPRIFNICYANNLHTQDLIFRAIGADIYINDSQGESTLAKILACLQDCSGVDLAEVSNLIYKVDKKTFNRTERVIENNDLNENSVNWRNLERNFYIPTTYLRTARSCPFSCAFCNYPTFAGSHALTSIEMIENELRYLCEDGVKNIIFIDDTFNVPLPRFKELCRLMIRNKFNFNWVSFFRCSNADDEAFALMQQSGCIGVYLGIESGDQQILKNMNKFANLDRYRYGIKNLTERGILTLASLIVGFPGETRESVLNTIDFLQDCPTTFYNVQLYYHDPLAPIQKRREEFGIRGAGYSWQHNSMDWKEAAYLMEYMIENISKSALLPLYSFSIWTVPYLLQHGMSVEQIIGFAKDASGLLLKSLPDTPVDFSDDIERMASNFRNFKPASLAK
jgi:radical SAM PhpK family P-methyltransferase